MIGPLLLRADAGPRIGTGHVMRLFALAQAWQDLGGDAVFAGDVGPLSPKLRAEGFRIETVTDAQQTAAVARDLGAAWVVLDGYGFDDEYEAAIADRGLKVLALDDFGHATHVAADVVLNQTLGGEAHLYAAKQVLLGPRFALLRREFQPRSPRFVPAVARKILVTLGGADPDNVTAKVIRALACLPAGSVEVLAIAGVSNPNLTALQALAEPHHEWLTLVQNVDDMAERLAWADLAVAAGGTSAWERAAMGLPAIVLILADNQVELAEGCAVAGLCRTLGWHHSVTEKALASSIDALLIDATARSAMATAGPRFVDGAGAARVAMILAGAPLRLRPARADDAERLFHWANDPVVRAAAFSPDPIPWPAHLDWFARKLASPDCRIFIAFDSQDVPIGQIRFDRMSSGVTEVDVAIATDHRGKKLAVPLIRQGVELVTHDGWALEIVALIRVENTASRRTFRAAGYVEVEEVVVRGVPTVRAVWSRALA